MTSRRLTGLIETPKYTTEDAGFYTIKMYYGGEFVLQPAFDYQKGRIEYFDYFNGEESSMLELRKLVKELKVNDKKVNFWFKYGTCRDPKFKKIKTDAELYNIVYEIPENKTVEIFVEHVVEDQWDYDVEMTHISDEVRIMNEVYANAIATPLSLGEGPSNFVAASLSDFYSTPNREYGDNLYSHEVEDNLKDTAINCKVTSEFVMVGHEDITENDCVQSEEVLRSLGSESEGEVSKHVATFQEKDLHKEGFKFQEGMIFNSSAEFKWAVKCHQAMRRKDIKFVKNEGRRYENKIINSGFLAKFYKDEFRLNTSWGRMEFQEHVKAKFNCQLSMHQSYRAKKQALKYLEGSEGEQFDLLHDYCEELRRTNPENKTRKMKKVGEVKRCRVCGQRGHNKTTCKFQNGQAQAAEIEVDENEAEFEKEDAFENVSIETQVPKFVLDEMIYLSAKLLSLPKDCCQAAAAAAENFLG
nr:Zinc knuckle family protein [Ipomoea batatas]GMD45323.1 Zinc knuckle family protein [Ipomoea batatas]